MLFWKSVIDGVKSRLHQGDDNQSFSNPPIGALLEHHFDGAKRRGFDPNSVYHIIIKFMQHITVVS